MEELEKAADSEADARVRITSPKKDPKVAGNCAPAIPTELFKKLQRTEDLVNHLKNENRSQKEELAELRLSLDQDSKLRYRGCNHPGKKQLRNSADGQPRSSSLVRMSPQKSGKLPLLKSRLSRFFT